MKRLLPRSLLGQVLLSVALALFVAQGISAFLQFREAERRREMGSLSGLAFQLVAEPRFEGEPRWRRLRVERTAANPLQPDERRDAQRETELRSILVDQGVEPARLLVVTRPTSEDAYVMGRLQERPDLRSRGDWTGGNMIVAALQRQGSTEWTVARVPVATGAPQQLGALITQTLLLYLVLVGGLAFVLRRITRPLAALRQRVETFARSLNTEGQVQPSGPEDARRLIAAHNAMEDRIAALLNEKNVMLGAIGHDLKTPLAALRVRIESVDDDAERAKLAGGIDDIARSLDDILSLARVGRPSDPLERTDLGALVLSVVEEYEDMGEPITLGDTVRLPMALRATWLRRAMRNLIGNALRYGERATVSLRRENGEAVIRIEDEGPGIPTDELAAMLEPFRRGETSRNRETGGAGLGLTLARAIAEQHGGRLVLTNRAPKGDKAQGLIAELRLPLD
ncbi:MAG: two-component sensor histidine kinase [Sphingomonadales bacterium 32-68-7]|nr:MAG: two-component sensor histidine kinase [Sphingomonadales bacterium 12-68-11]OYX08248.1 MAG: two-component sensor histidine kinase [Sphingomonadales bacterium 32-68-7]